MGQLTLHTARATVACEPIHAIALSNMSQESGWHLLYTLAQSTSARRAAGASANIHKTIASVKASIEPPPQSPHPKKGGAAQPT